MGKEVIDATDGPGFLVNRCNRPFGLEALKLLQERVADVETIDAIARAAGFRMGPFELQDLVGIDVGYEVSLSFHELSFGEPRWRPSPLSARMVAAGRLGRKSGRGWYEYPRERAEDPAPPAPGGGEDRLVVGGRRARRRPRAARAGGARRLRRARPGRGRGRGPVAADRRRRRSRGAAAAGRPGRAAVRRRLAARASTAAAAPWASTCCPRSEGAPLVELTRGPGTAPLAAERVEEFFAALGLRTVWVGDAPGLVLGRIVAQLVNEACFAVGEGVGSREDVDVGMVLGLNHPRGPVRVVRGDRRRARPRGARRPAHRARRGALSRRAAAAQAGDVSAGASPSHEHDG